MGILSPKSIDDCQHIATAFDGCECIISWNSSVLLGGEEYGIYIGN